MWSFTGEGRRLVEAALLTLFPPRCVACATLSAVPFIYGLCAPCADGLVANRGARCARCDLPSITDVCGDCVERPPSFARLRAPWIYQGGLRDLLVAAKFRGREDLAVAAGRLLAADAGVMALVRGARALVPVPLGRRRQRQRGYNQSAVLARALARAAEAPVAHALRRTRDTLRQSDLPLALRASNVAGAFAARPVEGRVVLVDDVVTSGETVRQAALALIAAGAREVDVVALSRATPDDPS